MAKLTMEQIPLPPAQYDRKHQNTLTRVLNLIFRKVDYTPESSHIAQKAASWMGL